MRRAVGRGKIPSKHDLNRKPNGLRYRRLEGPDSLTKGTKPKVTKNAILVVRIQPSACTHC